MSPSCLAHFNSLISVRIKTKMATMAHKAQHQLPPASCLHPPSPQYSIILFPLPECSVSSTCNVPCQGCVFSFLLGKFLGVRCCVIR